MLREQWREGVFKFGVTIFLGKISRKMTFHIKLPDWAVLISSTLKAFHSCSKVYKQFLNFFYLIFSSKNRFGKYDVPQWSQWRYSTVVVRSAYHFLNEFLLWSVSALIGRSEWETTTKGWRIRCHRNGWRFCWLRHRQPAEWDTFLEGFVNRSLSGSSDVDEYSGSRRLFTAFEIGLEFFCGKEWEVLS